MSSEISPPLPCRRSRSVIPASPYRPRDDFIARVVAAGGRVAIVGEANVEHIGGGSQTVRYTPDVLVAIERDRRRMWAKWGHF